MEGINQRIKELIVAEGLTASTFADRIGVLRSALSHILAGRNKPGADFIEKLLLEMPAVNANWLFTGQGNMYHTIARQEAVADTAVAETKKPGRQLDILSQLAEMFPGEYGPLSDTEEQEPLAVAAPVAPALSGQSPAAVSRPEPESQPGKKLLKIILVYDDKTFSELKPE